MPRSLTFEFDGTEFVCEISKVDRSKLYGSVTTETLDKNAQPCELATLAYDGRTLISHGGTAMGYMNPEGEWLTRDDLTAIDANEKEIDEVESSFKQTIGLEAEATEDDFLSHSVRLIYSLNTVDGDDGSFTKALDKGKIFTFEFSYRGGTSVDPAFILSNEFGMWLLITDPNQVDFASLAHAAVCARVEEPDEEEEDSEEIDFGML